MTLLHDLPVTHAARRICPGTSAVKPMFLADWVDVLFVHFEVASDELQPEVPFPLDLHDGRAYVSVVAFTQRDLRPTFGGQLTRWLSRPLACHEFLNIRTYVRVHGEPGIYFLAEWIPNRLATLIGPPLYGLPYRRGGIRYTIDRTNSQFHAIVAGDGSLDLDATIDTVPPHARAMSGSLTEFLVERYSAFTHRNGNTRRFRIEHEPWQHTRASVDLCEASLLEASGEWFRAARLIAADYSRGLHDVAIGPPEKLDRAHHPNWVRWAGPIVLPAIALALRSDLPAWGFMWALCFAMYFGCKWLTLIDAWHHAAGRGITRTIAYVLAWPGMDAAAFLSRDHSVSMPAAAEWLAAICKVIVAITILFVLVPLILPIHPLGGGWMGMIGLVMLVHFGLFHLLALVWRKAGIDATPIMNAPARARSLGEFWSSRWNRGFNDLATRYAFAPLARRIGGAGALLATFAISGVIHDAVISLPAGAGYGLATIYFLLQGVGVFAERGRRVRRVFRRHPWLGRAYVYAFTVGPAVILFHPPFVHNVFVPFLKVIGAT
jgi:uncharacterized protein YqjF (DUF2071 family)